MQHELGQYRAQLFDQLIAKLLAAMYPKAEITRKITLRVPYRRAFRSISLDFRLSMASGDVVVETKAPYSDRSVDAVNHALRGLSTVVDLLSPGRIKTFVLAIPIPFPKDCSAVLEEVERSASQVGASITVWDSTELLKQVHEHLASDIESFSIEELERVLQVKKDETTKIHLDRLKLGVNDNVVVLVADFCSFSRFVVASDSNHELMSSIMARFYRETGEAIRTAEGIIDKYIGDGILVYWSGDDAGLKLVRCVEELSGIAVNVAEEWQDWVDYSVEPKGLRAGAAIGQVMFVSEQPKSSTIHAIGSALNLAARLQGEASPNSLLISNRLRKRFFADRPEFEEVGPFDLKNIGSVIAWSKLLGTNPPE